MAELTAFFEARRGRLYGFRFRDFADFKSCAPNAAIAPTDQALGIGTGVRRAFQLVKRSGDLERTIAKPVAGSVRVAVNGIEAADGWSVETTTGVVTFTVAPAAGAEITAGFAFDTPVRFDADRVEITLETFGAGRVAALPLIEVRV